MSDSNGAPPVRKRVAILGAGPAGLAAAMALSESPEYSVHVYQMGWKAGGKCATGREAEHLRSLQNGSHYLFGCYENAIGLLAEAHRVLARHPGEASRFGSFERDLVPRNLIVSKQPAAAADGRGVSGDWFRYMPQNMAQPGDGSKLPSFFDFLTTGLQYAAAFAVDCAVSVVPASSRPRHLGARLCQWALPLCPHEPGLRARLTRAALAPARSLTNRSAAAASRLVRKGVALGALLVPEAGARALGRGWSQRWPRGVQGVRRAVDAFWERSANGPPQLSEQLRRSAVLLDLVGTLFIGFWVDGLHRPGGFARIDRLDFREWLARHGAREETRQSAIITSWYDAIISYERGDVEQGQCSAGLTVHSLLRAMVTYKGAFAYQLRAEVGDSLIAPLVRALELRGVQFHFFERVEQLVVDSSRGLATEVVLAKQVADPPAGARFIEVMDHELGQARCAWPAAPWCDVAAQIEPPLDSYYSTHQVGKRRLVLRPEGQRLDAADDTYFDVIISALPLQVMEDVLVDSSRLDGPHLDSLPGQAAHGPGMQGAARGLPPAWQECFSKLQVIESQAIRMWFNVPLRARDARDGEPSLGWQQSPPILSGHTPPHSTWEDNSQAVSIHAFPEAHRPRTIATLFGPLPTGALNPRTHAHYQAQKSAAQAAALAFVENDMLELWPGLQRQGEVAWDAFIDLEHRSGRARFSWQDVVANVGPNESYIACFPGTLQYRIRPDESGFANLYVAGDWTRNGFEIGSVEGAVVSGLKAAKALSGLAIPISAEHDLERGTLFE
jgi:uncharacterized protein with NAD-binding domain and iron-sulfur cluster